MMIPTLHYETEQLFIRAEDKACKSICITACEQEAGVTSVAMALAERYLLAGYNTLLVDLNLFQPSFAPVKSDDESSLTSLIEDKKTKKCFHGICCDNESINILQMRQVQHLEKRISEWKSNYDRVVIDTSPLLRKNKGNIPANVVASVCDSTILIVLAGYTNRSDLILALKLLNNQKTHLLGTILNNVKNPNLQEELKREIKRLTFLPKPIVNWLNTQIKNNSFLNYNI